MVFRIAGYPDTEIVLGADEFHKVRGVGQAFWMRFKIFLVVRPVSAYYY